MPTITQQNFIDITPEKFLEACSPVELMELDLLLGSPRFQARLKHTQPDNRGQKSLVAVASSEDDSVDISFYNSSAQI
jgi:hypothetical protein